MGTFVEHGVFRSRDRDGVRLRWRPASHSWIYQEKCHRQPVTVIHRGLLETSVWSLRRSLRASDSNEVRFSRSSSPPSSPTPGSPNRARHVPGGSRSTTQPASETAHGSNGKRITLSATSAVSGLNPKRDGREGMHS